MTSQRPVGIAPFKIWIDMRKADLKDAIHRYETAGLKPPEKWAREIGWLERVRNDEPV